MQQQPRSLRAWPPCLPLSQERQQPYPEPRREYRQSTSVSPWLLACHRLQACHRPVQPHQPLFVRGPPRGYRLLTSVSHHLRPASWERQRVLRKQPPAECRHPQIRSLVEATLRRRSHQQPVCVPEPEFQRSSVFLP